jgi:hypothetical protein
VAGLRIVTTLSRIHHTRTSKYYVRCNRLTTTVFYRSVCARSRILRMSALLMGKHLGLGTIAKNAIRTLVLLGV